MTVERFDGGKPMNLGGHLFGLPGAAPTPGPTPVPTPNPRPTPLPTPLSGAIALPAGDFTLEMWFTGPAISSGFHVLAALTNGSTNVGFISLGGASYAGYVGSGSFQSTVNIADGNRHHIVLQSTAAANNLMLVDGAQVGGFGPNNTTAVTGIQIAASGGSALSNPGYGSIDEVRVSKVGRYSSNYTVPTAPFTTDANTVALYHFDGTGAAS